MDVHDIKTIEVNAPANGESKDEWVEEHVRQLQQIFQKWQQPMGIDDQAYRQHLVRELTDYWKDPLLKTFIESI